MPDDGERMDAYWITAYLILAGLVIVESLLLALQTWEHRRYVRSCMRDLARHQPTGRVALFAPCKGLDLDFEANLRALLRQDYDNYEVTFIVESTDDPAYADDPPRDGGASLGAGAGGRGGPRHRQRPEGPQSARGHAASFAAGASIWPLSIPTPGPGPSGCGRWCRTWSSRDWGRSPAIAGSRPPGPPWPTPWSTA